MYLNRDKYAWNPPVRATLPVVLFFFVVNIFLVVVPLVPPSPGNEPYESIPYYLHAVVAFGILAAGGVYWLIWAVLLPKLGEYVIYVSMGISMLNTALRALPVNTQRRGGQGWAVEECIYEDASGLKKFMKN